MRNCGQTENCVFADRPMRQFDLSCGGKRKEMRRQQQWWAGNLGNMSAMSEGCRQYQLCVGNKNCVSATSLIRRQYQWCGSNVRVASATSVKCWQRAWCVGNDSDMPATSGHADQRTRTSCQIWLPTCQSSRQFQRTFPYSTHQFRKPPMHTSSIQISIPYSSATYVLW